MRTGAYEEAVQLASKRFTTLPCSSALPDVTDAFFALNTEDLLAP